MGALRNFVDRVARASIAALTSTVSGMQEVYFSAEKNDAAQSIATATFTKVTFNNEVSDPSGTFTNSRWTPGKLGMAEINAAVLIAVGADAIATQIRIYLNGSAVKTSELFTSGANGGQPQISAHIPITALTDYIEIYAYQASGVNKDIVQAAAYTYFSGKV